MNLLKTSFFSTIETAIKLASGFVAIKYIALESGPEGIAFFGQFQNFFSAFMILISGGFTTGLVRYSAQEKSGNLSPNNYMGNALGFGLFASLISGVTIFIFAQKCSMLALHSLVFVNIFYFLAICSISIMVYQVIISVLNGWGEVGRLIICKSTCSLLLLILSLILIKLYGVWGGLIALVSSQSITAFIAVLLIRRMENFKWDWLKPKFNFLVYKAFCPYWLMSVATLVSTPLILMLIRVHIAENTTWETVGLWEASWKISELYLLVITTALTTYYVPKLSQAFTPQAEQSIIIEVFMWGVIASSFLALNVYMCRAWIVDLLFSDTFSIVSDILGFQLLGSVIKIAAWVFAFHMIVKGKTRFFLVTELLFGTNFYLLSRLFFDRYGLIGLSYAYFVNYVLYFIYCSVYVYSCYRDQNIWQTKRMLLGFFLRITR